jgi:CheY-like chemotaxis protein
MNLTTYYVDQNLNNGDSATVHMPDYVKVLLVHREEATLRMLKDLLSRKGCMVRTSSSGLDGMLHGRSEKFDWVICGLDLPIITGLELIRTLRLCPTTKNSTVIILGDGEESAECRMHIERLDATIMNVSDFRKLDWSEMGWKDGL